MLECNLLTSSLWFFLVLDVGTTLLRFEEGMVSLLLCCQSRMGRRSIETVLREMSAFAAIDSKKSSFESASRAHFDA